jgi:hypothetical protein
LHHYSTTAKIGNGLNAHWQKNGYIFPTLPLHNSALKSKEIVPLMTTEMNLKDNRLSQMDRCRKTNTVPSHLHEESKVVEVIEAESGT